MLIVSDKTHSATGEAAPPVMAQKTITNKKALGNTASMVNQANMAYLIHEELIPGSPITGVSFNPVDANPKNGTLLAGRPFTWLYPSAAAPSFIQLDKQFFEEEESIAKLIDESPQWIEVDKELYKKYGADIANESVTFNVKDLAYAAYLYYFQGLFRPSQPAMVMWKDPEKISYWFERLLPTGLFLSNIGINEEYYQNALLSEVRLYDLTNVKHPEQYIVVLKKKGEGIIALKADEKFLYLKTAKSLFIYDTTIKSEPILVKTFDLLADERIVNADLVDWENRRAFNLSLQSFMIYDLAGKNEDMPCVSNLNSSEDQECNAWQWKELSFPKYRHNQDLDYIHQFKIKNETAYITHGTTGLTVIDLETVLQEEL